MRGTTKGLVVLGLVLLVAVCGTMPRAVTSQTGARAQPSTVPVQPSTIPAQPSTIPAQPATLTGLTLAFIAPLPCYKIVPVPGGFYGRCISSSGSGGDAATGVNLIGNDGVITDLPDPTKLLHFFADGANIVSQETGTERAPLLVIEPTTWAVKMAIPLPYPVTRLIGLTGSTAIVGGYEIDADGRRTGRLMAYEISGAKKWDVPFPDFSQRPRVRRHVEITHAGVLVFEENEEAGDRTTPRARMLQLEDGSTLWEGSGKGLSATPPERVGRTVLSHRVGRTVLYDDAGVPRSLATGAPTGRGPGPSAGAVAYEDDLILTNPLRRMTPNGETVWTLRDTSGTPATDGKTLVVLGTNGLVLLDPATGRRLGQAPDPSAPLDPCGTTEELIVATPRVIIAGACTRGATPVYTVNM